MVKQKKLIVIVGPTAIGKTALAIALAKQFKTEIISADSRQFFREMNIGTAKPSTQELSEAPHHFIDSHGVETLFSTGDFEVEALELMSTLFEKHDILILIGGSGLYIDAICKGLDNLPEIDLSIRENLNNEFETNGIDGIRAKLKALDPEYFEKVDQSNPQRMIRGLEVVLSTGEKLSSLLTNNKKERPFEMIKIGLNTDRAVLYDRINSRVDSMMQEGLLDEVRSLSPYRQCNALKTVGYAELFDYLDGETDLASAVAMIKQNTRRFAKRQLTWFRRDTEIAWFEPSEVSQITRFIETRLAVSN